jgi:hypothetical protein
MQTWTSFARAHLCLCRDARGDQGKADTGHMWCWRNGRHVSQRSVSMRCHPARWRVQCVGITEALAAWLRCQYWYPVPGCKCAKTTISTQVRQIAVLLPEMLDLVSCSCSSNPGAAINFREF